MRLLDPPRCESDLAPVAARLIEAEDLGPFDVAKLLIQSIERVG